MKAHFDSRKARVQTLSVSQLLIRPVKPLLHMAKAIFPLFMGQ